MADAYRFRFDILIAPNHDDEWLIDAESKLIKRFKPMLNEYLVY